MSAHARRFEVTTHLTLDTSQSVTQPTTRVSEECSFSIFCTLGGRLFPVVAPDDFGKFSENVTSFQAQMMKLAAEDMYVSLAHEAQLSVVVHTCSPLRMPSIPAETRALISFMVDGGDLLSGISALGLRTPIMSQSRWFPAVYTGMIEVHREARQHKRQYVLASYPRWRAIQMAENPIPPPLGSVRRTGIHTLSF